MKTLKWTKPRSFLLSRIITWLFIVILTAAVGGLPFILQWYIGFSGKSADILAPLLVTLWLCAVPAFAALFSLARILKNVSSGVVFEEKNVKLLRIISWCCFAVGAVFTVFCFYYFLALIIGVLAAFAALILRVVKNVFAQAVEIKSENDLTV